MHEISTSGDMTDSSQFDQLWFPCLNSDDWKRWERNACAWGAIGPLKLLIALSVVGGTNPLDDGWERGASASSSGRSRSLVKFCDSSASLSSESSWGDWSLDASLPLRPSSASPLGPEPFIFNFRAFSVAWNTGQRLLVVMEWQWSG